MPAAISRMRGMTLHLLIRTVQVTRGPAVRPPALSAYKITNANPCYSAIWKLSNPDATQSTPLRKRWTLDDDKRLMELGAKVASFNKIANALGRTEAAIEQRAHTLKRQAAAQRLLTPD
jgi:hypothetical protein